MEEKCEVIDLVIKEDEIDSQLEVVNCSEIISPTKPLQTTVEFDENVTQEPEIKNEPTNQDITTEEKQSLSDLLQESKKGMIDFLELVSVCVDQYSRRIKYFNSLQKAKEGINEFSTLCDYAIANIQCIKNDRRKKYKQWNNSVNKRLSQICDTLAKRSISNDTIELISDDETSLVLSLIKDNVSGQNDITDNKSDFNLTEIKQEIKTESEHNSIFSKETVIRNESINVGKENQTISDQETVVGEQELMARIREDFDDDDCDPIENCSQDSGVSSTQVTDEYYSSSDTESDALESRQTDVKDLMSDYSVFALDSSISSISSDSDSSHSTVYFETPEKKQFEDSSISSESASDSSSSRSHSTADLETPDKIQDQELLEEQSAQFEDSSISSESGSGSGSSRSHSTADLETPDKKKDQELLEELAVQFEDYKLKLKPVVVIDQIDFNNYYGLTHIENEIRRLTDLISSSSDSDSDAEPSAIRKKKRIKIQRNPVSNSNSDIIGSSQKHCHTGEKLFKCKMCDKSFTLQGTLNRHKLTHSSSKRYKCAICDKEYTRKYTLVEHMRCHTGEKPFKCEVCDKSFSKKSYLIMHVRVHTGDKPFKCDMCDKTFSQQSNAVSHKLTHSDIKHYKCDSCDKLFRHKFGLVAHSRFHTGEKLYKCDMCDKVFTKRSYLSEHKLTHSDTKLQM